MNKDETMLDEELDTEVEEDTPDDVEYDATTDGDSDDEFEYDEDGNIIIPDIVDNGDAEEEDDETDEEDSESEEYEESEDSKETEEVVEHDSEPKQENKELAELQRRYDKLVAQGRETLTKLGVKTENVEEGLASLAAEADGVSTEEYLAKKANAERDEQARRLLQQQEFEKIARADLAELQAAYPETRAYKNIRDIPPEILKEFGRYRDMGLPAKKAYAAANPDGIRTTVATAVKKQSLHDSKTHLRTAVPKGSKDDGIVMPKSELAVWREIFPGKSDKEIRALYKNTAN